MQLARDNACACHPQKAPLSARTPPKAQPKQVRPASARRSVPGDSRSVTPPPARSVTPPPPSKGNTTPRSAGQQVRVNGQLVGGAPEGATKRGSAARGFAPFAQMPKTPPGAATRNVKVPMPKAKETNSGPF